MKKISYLSIFAACALGFAACDSAINNYMVDDTVALLNPGLVTTNVYLGLDNPTEVYVLKSGKGFQGADVSISVDDVVLSTYNASAAQSISLIPADCYTLTVSTLHINPDDYQVPFVITWNRDRLADALAANPNIGLPLRLSVNSTGVNINDERLTTIIQPVIEQPLVSLVSSGYQIGLMPTRKSTLEELVYMDVQTNFIPSEDIDYTLAIDPTLVEEYNQEHNTDFQVLPEGAYDLALDGWKIKKSMKSNRFHFTFKREALIPADGPSTFGNFMLPIRLQNVSSSNIDQSKAYVLYTVTVVASKIDKSKWTIYSCNSDIRTIPNWDKVEGNYPPEFLIDGTTNTHWRSIWTEPTEMPVEVVIDFGVDRDLYKIGIEAPTSTNRRYFNSKAGTVEVSLSPDGPWTKVADWSYPSKGTSAYEFDVKPSTGRYLKFIINESYDGTSKMAISEISAWGE